MISSEDYQKVEIDLRSHLDKGVSLEDALRILHCEEKIGIMLLWPAVMSIRQIDKQEAMRIVVHATAPWND